LIYLDNNATTDLHPEVASRIVEEIEKNPPRPHDNAHLLEQFEKMFGLKGGRVYITSGGTENSAIAFATAQAVNPRGRIVCNLGDHLSVLNQRGMVASKTELPIEMLPISPDGHPDAALFHQAMGPGLSLVTFNLVNSETGVILTELPEMVQAVRAARPEALIFVDACQAMGKLDVTKMPEVDMIGISAHKFHGPRGVGAIWVRKGVSLQPAHGGGFQQEGSRPGQYSDYLAWGMTHAIGLMHLLKLAENAQHMLMLRERMDLEMVRIANCTINFGDCARVCNTSSYLIKGVDTKLLRLVLKKHGVIVSDTTAGLKNTTGISPLMAFLHSQEDCYSNLRLSLSYCSTEKEVLQATEIIGKAVKILRSNPIKLHAHAAKEDECDFSGKATHCPIGGTTGPDCS
jgi:cysteine desulfurase